MQFAQHGGVQAITEAILKTENITLKVCDSCTQPQQLPSTYILPQRCYGMHYTCIVSVADEATQIWGGMYVSLVHYESNCTLLPLPPLPSLPLSPPVCLLQELKALFYPFSQCEDYLNQAYLKSHLSKPIVVAIKFVGDLSDSDFKDKEVSSLSLLCSSSLFFF